MKITLFKKALVLLLVIGGLTFSAQAQQTAGRHGAKMTPEARVEKMATELNLSADQKTQLLQLEKNQAGKMQRPQKDATAEQKTQYAEARKAHREAQRKLLTAEQATKFDAMRSEHKGKKGDGTCKGKGNGKIKKA